MIKSLFIAYIAGLLFFVALRLTSPVSRPVKEQGSIRVQEYRPNYGARVLEYDPKQGLAIFEHGKEAQIGENDSIVFMLKPDEVLYLAPNGTYQIRVDYEEQDQLEGQADIVEGKQP